MGLFSEDECITAESAASKVQASLRELGYDEWSVIRGPGASGNACVGASIDAETGQVILLMALAPDLRASLDELRDRLLDECHSKDEAADLVRSLLTEHGLQGWELRVGGRINVPSERNDEAMRHIAAGCWIYSGTGWTEDGTRLFWVGGD